MTQSIQADLFFQICIQDFADAFGIQDPALLEPQKREIVPEYVEIDTVVSFPDDFDFTTLQDRIFPFWGKENVIEYKGRNDRLTPMHLCQYDMTELGIMTTHLLSKPRKDRKGRQPLSLQAAKEQVKRLTAQGATHICCNTILSTKDPVGLREGSKFEAVDTYDHLVGALYRETVRENDFVGNISAYLVVLNDLPVHPKNAPLLLLSTGKKQTEFCNWLLDTHDGLTLVEQQRYLMYLAKYQLVEDKEIRQKMSKKIIPNVSFVTDLIGPWPEEYQDQIMQHISKRDSPIEAAQKILQADSPLGVAQAALQVDSPQDAYQAALEADSPEEAALTFIQSEEQVNRLLELIQQRKFEPVKA